MNDGNAEKLAAYVRSLKDFEVVSQPEDFQYDNFGAVILDSVLQAGMSYKSVVEPRIKAYLAEFGSKKTLAEFKALIEKQDLADLIRFRNREKIERVFRLVRFFDVENITRVEELRAWLGNDANVLRLRTVKGVGPKTADYMKMLVGIAAVAVDVNLIRFLNLAGVNLRVGNYEEARSVIVNAAKLLNLEPSILDYSIWHHVSSKNRSDR